MTATKIKELSTLYKLSEPIPFVVMGGDQSRKTEYVIIKGSYILPSNEYGDSIDGGQIFINTKEIWDQCQAA